MGGKQLWGSEKTVPAGDHGVGEGSVPKKTQGQIHQKWQLYTTSAPPPSPRGHSGLEWVSIPRFCASDTRLLSSLQAPLLF